MLPLIAILSLLLNGPEIPPLVLKDVVAPEWAEARCDGCMVRANSIGTKLAVLEPARDVIYAVHQAQGKTNVIDLSELPGQPAVPLARRLRFTDLYVMEDGSFLVSESNTASLYHLDDAGDLIAHFTFDSSPMAVLQADARSALVYTPSLSGASIHSVDFSQQRSTNTTLLTGSPVAVRSGGIAVQRVPIRRAVEANGVYFSSPLSAERNVVYHCGRTTSLTCSVVLEDVGSVIIVGYDQGRDAPWILRPADRLAYTTRGGQTAFLDNGSGIMDVFQHQARLYVLADTGIYIFEARSR